MDGWTDGSRKGITKPTWALHCKSHDNRIKPKVSEKFLQTGLCFLYWWQPFSQLEEKRSLPLICFHLHGWMSKWANDQDWRTNLPLQWLESGHQGFLRCLMPGEANISLQHGSHKSLDKTLNSSAIFRNTVYHSAVPSEQGLCLRPSRWLFSLQGPAERKAPAGWQAAHPPFAQLEDWPLYYPGHLSQPRSSVYMQKRGSLNKFDTCSRLKHQCNSIVSCVTCIHGPCSLW